MEELRWAKSSRISEPSSVVNGRQWFRATTSIPISSQNTDAGQAFPAGFPKSPGLDNWVKVWERPIVQLFAIFLLLGLFAWWTFQTVSLPPALRDLFEEDSAIATAAVSSNEEERFDQELRRLPAPPENHAPEVAALLQRLRTLPPAPYILQVARQRDSAVRQGENAPPWNPAELAAEAESKAAFLAAWEPFLSGPPVEWEKYPDSARLFRSNLFTLLENPNGQKFAEELFFGPDFRFIKMLRGLGALRFGSLSSWSFTDTVMLSKFLLDKTTSFQGSDDLLRATVGDFPPPPTADDLRSGLRVDRSLFLSAAQYLESLPPSTSAQLGLTSFLDEPGDAEWFLGRLPKPDLDVIGLAAHLRQASRQISSLEQRTFLPYQAWRQWLAGNPAQGLPVILADSLRGIEEFETTRTRHQLTQAFLKAALAFREAGLDASRQTPDPARPGQFLQVETSDGGTVISTSWQPDPSTEPPSFTLWPATESP